MRKTYIFHEEMSNNSLMLSFQCCTILHIYTNTNLMIFHGIFPIPMIFHERPNNYIRLDARGSLGAKMSEAQSGGILVIHPVMLGLLGFCLTYLDGL